MLLRSPQVRCTLRAPAGWYEKFLASCLRGQPTTPSLSLMYLGSVNRLLIRWLGTSFEFTRSSVFLNFLCTVRELSLFFGSAIFGSPHSSQMQTWSGISTRGHSQKSYSSNIQLPPWSGQNSNEKLSSSLYSEDSICWSGDVAFFLFAHDVAIFCSTELSSAAVLSLTLLHWLSSRGAKIILLAFRTGTSLLLTFRAC